MKKNKDNKKEEKKESIVSKILFNIIGFIIPIVILFLLINNFGSLILFVEIPTLIALICFKKTRIGALIVVAIVIIYILCMPLIQKKLIQNTCDTYGEGFKPVRRVYDNKGKEGYSNAQTDAFEWACCPSDAQGITGTANIEELTAAGCIGAK